MKYIDSHRKALKRSYSTFADFDKKFEVPQDMLDLLMEEGEKVGVKPKDEEELNQSLPQLKLQLKALVARDLWDTSEYFQVMYSTNNFVKKALELLN